MWILLSVIYGLMIGFYNVLRQKASDRSPILFVIALTCSVAFLAISWSVPEAIAVGGKGVALFLLKSVIVFSLWVFELLAFKNYFSNIKNYHTCHFSESFFPSFSRHSPSSTGDAVLYSSCRFSLQPDGFQVSSVH